VSTEKERRRIVEGLIARLKDDMLLAVDRMPDDWDEVEIGWLLLHRAALLGAPSDGENRLRRKAFDHAVRRLGF
jgi:hypothetical protein